MAEEDQGSHFDDPEEQEPIKVSVTFKTQEQETDEKHGNSDQACDEDKPSPGDPQTNEDKCSDSEAEEPSLPANPPVTPIPSYLDADKVNSDGHKIEQQEVLEGWKGYSNNIYIQPIIVNHASCGENQCLANKKTQRRLTSEDLRKQMRLREANNWIKKHNERIQSTGTLRSKAHTQEKRREQTEKQIQNKTEDNDNAKYKQKKLKIQKGFVCRTWATKFLSNDARKSEDDEFIPFYVRKYVDRSKSAWHNQEKQTTSVAEESMLASEVILTKKDQHNKLTTNASEELSEIEVQLKEKPSYDEFNNKRNSEKHKRTGKDNAQILTNVPHELICSCGQTIPNDKDKRIPRGFQGTTPLRSDKSRNSKVRFSVALPIKQFPPINPLEELKKANFTPKKKRGVSLNRRPHTVDTALLSKGVILVNGHSNLPNFTSANKAFNRQYGGQTFTTSSLENLHKENQICSQVKNEPGKRFDEFVELMPWGSSKTHNRNGTPQCALNDEQNDRDRRGRHRSLSDPRRLSKTPDENRNNNRNSAECLTGNRRRIRTPIPSLNSEDDDSNTDSNDTGMGSELEYSVDGLAKLDVYLQPRNASFHDD